MVPVNNRYEFTLLFDVENGNPNGNPDGFNAPRTDPVSGVGIVTDCCLKHKVRKYVKETKDGAEGYEILIDNDRSLTDKFTEARGCVEKSKSKGIDIASAREYMCRRYYDVRTFGAVMSTGEDGVSCGRVCGPVQINIARSVDVVNPVELTIMRQAVTRKEKFDRLFDRIGAPNEMGRKYVIPYALYRADGYVSAKRAEESGFTEDDLEIFWNALINMFDCDHASVRGKVIARNLFVFRHDSVLGNAPSHVLFDKIRISAKDGAACTMPQGFSDYQITVDGDMPSGVEMIKKL